MYILDGEDKYRLGRRNSWRTMGLNEDGGKAYAYAAGAVFSFEPSADIPADAHG